MDNHVELVKRHESVIVSHLQITDVLPYLMTIKTISANCEHILSTNELDPRKATSMLLQYLQESSEPGWYQTFVEALKDKDYEFIVRTLEGYVDVKEQNYFSETIKLFYPELCKVDPTQMLPYLSQTGCISKEDVERIQLYCNSRGSWDGAIKMLIDIERKAEDWFSGLMYALAKSGHEEIVDTIDKDLGKAARKSFDVVKKVANELKVKHQCNNVKGEAENEKEFKLHYTEDVKEQNLQCGTQRDMGFQSDLSKDSASNTSQVFELQEMNFHSTLQTQKLCCKDVLHKSCNSKLAHNGTKELVHQTCDQSPHLLKTKDCTQCVQHSHGSACNYLPAKEVHELSSGLEEQSLSSVDAILLYCQTDAAIAVQFKNILEDTVCLKDHSHPQIASSELNWNTVAENGNSEINREIQSLSRVVKHAKLIFIIMGKDFVEHYWTKLENDPIFRKLLWDKSEKKEVVPVHTLPSKECNYTMPSVLETIKGVKFNAIFRRNASLDMTKEALDKYFIQRMQKMFEKL